VKRLVIGGLAALAIALGIAAPAQAYPTMPQGVQGPFTVTKVVDGDTIWVDFNGQRQKIRMIGLDTPESLDPRKPVQCFALEASAEAKTMLAGRSVYLETDPSQDSVDRYGRTLAYVWTESGRLLNLDMIAEGFAHEYIYYLPYRYQPIFRTAEDDARTQERGLWSPGTCAT
jgi:micrococcal nuclease